ncbi:hypothetical protein BCR43DRAFT_508442 [Syncephalastrum racemosum]|uniref:C2H2-type domain-containing protein n=1 Tax=Syncephalastrum racemosum TaxID=13706 RepID=A0A1X2H3I5_SYNRA|nr:hypothetical protein BCR43DRAFT_508442 [Syncephalastrum racemosum]
MTKADNECELCGDKLKNSKNALKDHNYNKHTSEVYVGDSLLAVKRSTEGFICPVCDKLVNTTAGFKRHINGHHLTVSIEKKRMADGTTRRHPYEPSDESEQEQGNSSGTDDPPKYEMLQHIPTPALVIDGTSNRQKKRKSLTFSQTILASSDSLAADSNTQADKIMIAQLGRWVPIIYERGEEQHGFLTSSRTAALMLQDAQQTGTWKSPVPDAEICSSSLLPETDGDCLIEHIKATCHASKKLCTTRHVELTHELVNILNRDWLEYPQMRFCGSQLLAGAILLEGQTSIVLNTVEPYGRDPLLDAHYERQSGSFSSFPETSGTYGLLSILLFDTSDGKKLIIGTRPSNFLVTASMRLDTRSINLGPTTSHFSPSEKTRIFLDKKSIELVAPMLTNPEITEAQTMPALYQLRQLRSRFDCLSTYTKCRASSTLSSRLHFQPTSIWTLSAQDGTSQANLSQDKIGSLVFRIIATKVLRDGRRAVLRRDDVDPIMALAKNTKAATILRTLIGLFGDENEINIIGNRALNGQLIDLANKIAKKNEDEKKIQCITGELYD